jgi:FdhE protein
LKPSSNPTRFHDPKEILERADLKIPPLILPDRRTVFAERALRLRQLAAGHALHDYLMLMAVVCDAQHDRLQRRPDVALPTDEQIDLARLSGYPLLNTANWARSPVWRVELRALLAQVLEKLPDDSPAHAGVDAVIALPDDALEQQADRLLAGVTLNLNMAAAPLIAAGLQLYWTHLVTATKAAHKHPFDLPFEPNHCPCCGGLPSASITKVRGQLEGQRYLQCALCSAQWHYMRVKCANCGSIEGIHYRALQHVSQEEPSEDRAAVEAETCDQCHHYLKIMHMASDTNVEPMADDLATLTLDLLVSGTEYQRYGTNLLLLFGDDESAAKSP